MPLGAPRIYAETLRHSRGFSRYPGGKTWLVPLFRRWMMSLPSQPEVLVEPFAGGGIISLTAGFEQLADSVVMVELDEQIAAVWKTILGGNAECFGKRLFNIMFRKQNKTVGLQKKQSKRK